MEWTPWVSGDDPTGMGDYETLRFGKNGYGTYITDANGIPGNAARALYVNHRLTCHHPIEIQCRDAASHVAFHLTGDNTNFPNCVKCTTDQGLACVNANQKDGACHNYQVKMAIIVCLARKCLVVDATCPSHLLYTPASCAHTCTHTHRAHTLVHTRFVRAHPHRHTQTHHFTCHRAQTQQGDIHLSVHAHLCT